MLPEEARKITDFNTFKTFIGGWSGAECRCAMCRSQRFCAPGAKSILLINFDLVIHLNVGLYMYIHVNPPGLSGSLPEMWPDSHTPGSETEPPGCENTKTIFFFQTIIFVHMYGNNGHLLLEGN